MNAIEIKERPILFSAPMSQAILEGRKTQTRRVIKDVVFSPELIECGVGKRAKYYGNESHFKRVGPIDFKPYGQPGDRLYVKETFYAYGRWIKQYSATKNRDEWFFQDMVHLEGKIYQYADNPPEKVEKKRVENVVGWYKRPSLFMPYYASRILLEITDVRVERLQDISEADAKAEGVKRAILGVNGGIFGQQIGQEPKPYRQSFAVLWQSINGPESWNENPFVWAINFKRIKP